MNMEHNEFDAMQQQFAHASWVPDYEPDRPGINPAEPEPTKGALTWLDEEERLPPRYTVDRIIPADCLVAVFGQPKHGKSFFVIDVAACVATGTPWNGHAVEQGWVVYIAGEGRRGVVARFDAWSAHYGVKINNIALRTGIPLNQPGSAEHIIAEVHAAMAERGLDAPALIIADTLKRNFAGDQNTSKDMSMFVNSCTKIREAFKDSTIIVVNHSGHSEKERMGGSIDLLAALDAEYKVEKKDNKVVVTNTNMKDDEEIDDPFAFEFKPYDLSFDRKAAVLMPCDAPQETVKLTMAQERGLRALRAAADKYGALHDDGSRGVKREDWKKCFADDYPGERSGINSAFSQTVAVLKGKYVNQNGDLFQLTYAGGAGE